MKVAKLSNRLSLVLAFSLSFSLGWSAVPQASAQFTRKHLYSPTADPKADIAAGLAEAKREHKRVILDFGGDWCGDCQVLDIYFHDQSNADLLAKNFVIVHIYVSESMDNIIPLGKQYGVPLSRGVPALSVLDANGKVLHAQATGDFADMRHMDPASVHDFLLRWKA